MKIHRPRLSRLIRFRTAYAGITDLPPQAQGQLGLSTFAGTSESQIPERPKKAAGLCNPAHFGVVKAIQRAPRHANPSNPRFMVSLTSPRPRWPLSAIDRSVQGPDNANPNTQERNTMSPNVGNFVHDLVEMAKAMETLPQVEARVRELEAHLDHANETIQTRELSIISYKSELDGLYAKVRTVEAERDDAEIRFLELDEKAAQVDAILRSIMVSAEHGKDLIVPPKPQPEPVVEVQPKALSPNDLIAAGASSAGYSEPQPDWKQDQAETSTLRLKYPHAGHGYDEPQGQGGALPTQSGSNSTDGGGQYSISTNTETPQPPVSQDQSEVNPTATAEVGELQAAPIQNVSSGGSADTTKMPEPTGPYTNKLYHDHPLYVHPHDWIAGGGTEENYRYRPDVA